MPEPRRLVVRLDAMVEAVLGAGTAALAVAAPHHGVWRLPDHVPVTLVAVIALALLALAVGLWQRSRRPTRPLLLALSIGNAATALALLGYATVAPAGTAVRVLLAGGGIALVVLAGAQLAVARAPETATVTSTR